jgi:hypothetical protein
MAAAMIVGRMRTSAIRAVPAAACLLGALALAAPAADAAGAEGTSDPSRSFDFRAAKEFGQLMRFKIIENGEENRLWFDRFSVATSMHARFGESSEAAAGFWGTYLFVLPENISPSYLGSQYKRTYIGPSHGWFRHGFGDPEAPRFALTLGMFPYKYNPEASNLGEYLYRSLAYPTVVFSGGLSPSLSDAPVLEGALARLRTGPWTHDFLLTTETTLAQFYDWTAAYLLRGDLFGGLLSCGGGVAFTNVLSVDEDKTTPKTPVNGYFVENGRYYSGHQDYLADSANWYRNYAKLHRARGDTAAAAREEALAAIADSTFVYGSQKLMARAAAARKRAEGQTLTPDEEQLLALPVSYYTFASTKLMARFTLDPQARARIPWLGREDLKVFAEAALLGVANQPIFYEDRLKRIPVMFGANLPAFGWLDRLSFQVEWFGTADPVSTASIGSYAAPLPAARVYREPAADKLFYTWDRYDRDDWKWSLQAKRQLLPGLSIYAQAARDHFRTYSFVTSYGHGTDPGDVLTDDSHWYWLVNFVFGI